MSADVKAIVFRNRDGFRLFGTLHVPLQANSEYPTIVLLSPGIKMRVGPHRLYNRLTHVLNGLGFTVFKFDFFGLGDSEGELDRALLSEVYNDTESGRFVSDSSDALDWLEKNLGITDFILGGLCGGAITGLLLAQNDSRVKGLVSLGMTVTLSMGNANRTKFASQAELAEMRKGYFRRLVSPKSWFRLLTFQSDFQGIFHSFNRVLGRSRSQAEEKKSTDDSSTSIMQTDANPLFSQAFFAMTESGRKTLMIFSECDRAFMNYQEKFAQRNAERLANVSESYELHVVAGANHVFSFREWEQEMISYVSTWLTDNFCGVPRDALT